MKRVNWFDIVIVVAATLVCSAVVVGCGETAAAVCGNAIVETGEECDDGDPDPANASCQQCVLTCETDFDDCDDDATNGCETSICGGTCEAPGGSVAFEYSGEIDSFEIPGCATTVGIEAWGAQGGGGPTVSGGQGARIAGTFTVSGGELLSVLVGGQGQDATSDSDQGGGSGGGGTFVIEDDDDPWIIAGGGGGALYSREQVGGPDNVRQLDGGPGQITERGQDGDGGGVGGDDGLGGTPFPSIGWHAGTGGGGLLGDGIGASTGNAKYGTANGPGMSYLNGGAGGLGGSEGRDGGFGGGGAAGAFGAGGGGFSGGGGSSYGGVVPGAQTYGGGGGGSFNGGTDPDAESGVREGNGRAVISWLP